jgi:MoaA/NifB/PqqE/SkfB family radical SAM enzyme
MKRSDIFRAWGRILRGYRPFLSIEITKECPLRCPGCYAYEPQHLPFGGLRELSDLQGKDLIDGVLALVRRLRPLHLSIVGGEPLVRYRELDILLPRLNEMGIEVQLVTSAVRPIPVCWKDFPNLHILVSIDGLQPEHDKRRAPATYDRILKHIAGHEIVVHCTITRQHVQQPEYLGQFASFWSDRPEVRKIWFSLFTPQRGQETAERLTPVERTSTVNELARLTVPFPKIDMSRAVLEGYFHPPTAPRECIFAQATTCISADLATRIVPCQFGGDPVCAECGCIASAALASIGRYKLASFIPVAKIFDTSRKAGEQVNHWLEYRARLAG